MKNGNERTASVIAVMNMKGGVAKTTTAEALAAAMAEEDMKVLLIDFDPQASATSCLGFGVEDEDYDGPITEEMLLSDDISLYGIAEIMNDNMKKTPENDWHELVVKTSEGFDFIPSSIDLASVEADMQTQAFYKEAVLKRALSYMRPEYDYIIIDCPPTLSLLFTNATTAADMIIIPVSPEKSALRGFRLLYKKIVEIRDLLNPELEIAGIVITKVDARSNKVKENLETIRKLSDVVHIFDTVIPYGVKDAEYAIDSNVSFVGLYNNTRRPTDLLSRIATAYRNIAKEVIG